MANWISSKLKVAETFLQQIDQQAAESLGKNDKPRSDELSQETPRKSTDVVPLKDQLKKKRTTEAHDFVGKLSSDHNVNLNNGNNNTDYREKDAVPSAASPRPSTPPPKSGLTDSDWTELLGAPSQPMAPAVNRHNGISSIRGLRKDIRKQGSSGSNSLVPEAKRKQKVQNIGSRNLIISDAVTENKVNNDGTESKLSGGENSDVKDKLQRISSVELRSDGDYSEGKEWEMKKTCPSPAVAREENVEGDGAPEAHRDKEHLQSIDSPVDADLHSFEDPPAKIASVTLGGNSDIQMGMVHGQRRLSSSIKGINKNNVAQQGTPSLKSESLSITDGGTDSDTGSTSNSDSESEHEREERRRRRAQVLAEKAAVKAIESIKERENMVARLEGEKQSLEKILEERAKQQVEEASKLQNTMIEMMEAVELEKQKHNNTRMEALARLAKLETANAELARSLGAVQWKLEVEINQVADLRQQIELKEANNEELKRKISATHHTGNQWVAAKGVEFEREILDAEYTFVTEKIGQLQEKAKTLETNIEMTQKEIDCPTEVEAELKRRLAQLTDHLIQKQAQVEALSSEKAMLLFRIESVSRLLDENKSNLCTADVPTASTKFDVESGIWEFSNSKLKPLFEGRIHSGQKHLGLLVRQLDSIFCAGSMFLRRNSTARLWSIVYFVCLHLWVMYILMFHSPVSDETRSGAVFSLENINNTGGI
ncbi:hypothetical protein NMG60_11024129 [Bertholletia excelsa]